MKKQLVDMKAFSEEQAKEPYYFNLGLEINFRHKNPFIAFIDNVTLKESKSENSDYNAYQFDKQFMKYL
tara:strand:+ start:287 stop:493 length:207 start_codon:yes stop_codon:yes gene_type:complete